MKLMLSIVKKAIFTAVVGAAATQSNAADRAESAFQEARQAIAKGKYDAAIARLDEAVRLDPKQAKYHGVRGAANLHQQNYAQGVADLKAAIARNPGDAGVGYQPTTDKKLSEESLRHGRKQVADMLRDRPAMAQYGREANFLTDWATKKFAGEDFGDPIDWDPSPPLHSDAEHLAPGHGMHAAILVQPNYAGGPMEGKPRTFEELWAGAIYELHNVNYAKEFIRLSDEADEGRVTKDAFVAGILRYELAAAQRTRAFYVQVYLPWAEKKKLATDPSLWFCGWWDTPEGVLKSFSDKSAYPWRPYAREHDWATVHRHWRGGNFQKAQKLLDEMCKETGYDEEIPDIFYWIGQCCAAQKKPAEAEKALSEAIRLDPEHAEAYAARGEVYEKLGEKEKAKADFEKAKKLEGGE